MDRPRCRKTKTTCSQPCSTGLNGTDKKQLRPPGLGAAGGCFSAESQAQGSPAFTYHHLVSCCDMHAPGGSKGPVPSRKEGPGMAPSGSFFGNYVTNVWQPPPPPPPSGPGNEQQSCNTCAKQECVSNKVRPWSPGAGGCCPSVTRGS